MVETPSRPAIDGLLVNARMDGGYVGDVEGCHHADVVAVAVLARPEIETFNDREASSAGARYSSS